MTKRQHHICEVIAGILAGLLIIYICCGCAYTLIHKRDLTEFRTLHRASRGFMIVKPEFDADLVNKGLDSMDRTLELWIGEWKDANDGS